MSPTPPSLRFTISSRACVSQPSATTLLRGLDQMIVVVYVRAEACECAHGDLAAHAAWISDMRLIPGG